MGFVHDTVFKLFKISVVSSILTLLLLQFSIRGTIRKKQNRGKVYTHAHMHTCMWCTHMHTPHTHAHTRTHTLSVCLSLPLSRSASLSVSLSVSQSVSLSVSVCLFASISLSISAKRQKHFLTYEVNGGTNTKRHSH